MRVVKPALQDSELQQLDSAREAKFPHAVGFMDLHRLDDHVQPLRDLLVAVPLRTESKDAQLPFGHRSARPCDAYETRQSRNGAAT